jgi:AraC-like DNA-binding protein
MKRLFPLSCSENDGQRKCRSSTSTRHALWRPLSTNLPYYNHLQTILDGTLVGVEQGWLLPAVHYHAPGGFGEESWVDALPETFIAVGISGGSVRKIRGTKAGSTSRPGFSPSFEPAGVGNYYTAPESIEFAHIHLSDALLDRASEMVGVQPLSGRLRDDLVFFDDASLVALVGHYVQRAFDTVSIPTSLEMEGRAFLIFDQLITLHGNMKSHKPERGGLSQRSLRQVTDYIRDHLAEDIRIDDLAGLVGLSPQHFSRTFKQSTGFSPHQWLVVQRVERACELLVSNSLSIVQIAMACGFGDQSHLTLTFRQLMGITPARFRKAKQR